MPSLWETLPGSGTGTGTVAAPVPPGNLFDDPTEDSWALTGPPGAQGNPGPTGTAGPVGPAVYFVADEPTADEWLGPNLSKDGTLILSNKRIQKRVLALSAGSATPAINTDAYDVVHITAQSAAITSFTTGLSGTPVDGDTLRISITDNGTARALTWGTSFESSTVTLPTTTVISTRLDVGFFWNTETTKWRCVAVA